MIVARGVRKLDAVLFSLAVWQVVCPVSILANEWTDSSHKESSCSSTGDIDNDGVNLTLGDFKYLVDYLYHFGPPPNPLYESDLNGDGYVDAVDIETFKCYLLYGYSCFPQSQFPIAVACQSDTVHGACCDQTITDSCAVFSPANCLARNGTYHGNGTHCAPNPCGNCYPPPSDLIAWWPLDEVRPSMAHDILGGHDGNQEFAPIGPAYTQGRVNGAFRFSWHDLLGNPCPTHFAVSVPNDPFRTIGTGDFTIDAWIYPEAAFCGTCDFSLGWGCPYYMIVDNMVFSGLRFFVKMQTDGHGKLGLAMSDISTVPQYDPRAFLSQTAPVVLGQWQHVAVTVTRPVGGPAIGTFFYNGQALNGQTFTPLLGTVAGVFNNGVDIGHGGAQHNNRNVLYPQDDCGGANNFFTGRIDEVEIFKRSLSGTEISGIYSAKGIGKCHDYCYLPSNVGLCDGSPDVSIDIRICNESTVPAQFRIDFTGDPPGVSCPLNGTSLVFSPNHQSIQTLLPGSCAVYPVTISRPSGFVIGDEACFTCTVTNLSTGLLTNCQSSLVGVRCAVGTTSSGHGSIESDVEYAVVGRSTPKTLGAVHSEQRVDNCSCCSNTGNVDCDPGDGVDISDLAALIDNLYISFTQLCCTSEANTDGQPGIDISDLSALIDYLYISFTPTAVCQ